MDGGTIQLSNYQLNQIATVQEHSASVNACGSKKHLNNISMGEELDTFFHWLTLKKIIP